MDFLHLGGFLLLTSLVFMSIGVCRPKPTSSSPSSIFSTTLTLTLLNEGIPNFFHLKIPFLFFSKTFSSCACMELQWHWSLRTSSFNLFISTCWAITSRLEWHRVGGSSPRFGLRVLLKEPLQSIWRLILLCSENITWITARTGKRSFWAAWRDASGESFRLSISLHRFFLSCFDVFGCACHDTN